MPVNVGWGVQAWGSSPWGGYSIPDQVTTGQTAGWDRYERVHRQWEYREQREERNVVFRVKGLRAYARVGEAMGRGGRGLAAFPHGVRAFARAGAATCDVTTEARLTSQQLQMLLGQVKVEGGVGGMTAEARGRVGKPIVKAVRNLSDEELIHFLLDIT
jgi:hypothetical protein